MLLHYNCHPRSFSVSAQAEAVRPRHSPSVVCYGCEACLPKFEWPSEHAHARHWCNVDSCNLGSAAGLDTLGTQFDVNSREFALAPNASKRVITLVARHHLKKTKFKHKAARSRAEAQVAFATPSRRGSRVRHFSSHKDEVRELAEHIDAVRIIRLTSDGQAGLHATASTLDWEDGETRVRRGRAILTSK
jgi:hypothetical protein